MPEYSKSFISAHLVVLHSQSQAPRLTPRMWLHWLRPLSRALGARFNNNKGSSFDLVWLSTIFWLLRRQTTMEGGLISVSIATRPGVLVIGYSTIPRHAIQHLHSSFKGTRSFLLHCLAEKDLVTSSWREFIGLPKKLWCYIIQVCTIVNNFTEIIPNQIVCTSSTKVMPFPWNLRYNLVVIFSHSASRFQGAVGGRL